jgi:hypothetical protein
MEGLRYAFGGLQTQVVSLSKHGRTVENQTYLIRAIRSVWKSAGWVFFNLSMDATDQTDTIHYIRLIR